MWHAMVVTQEDIPTLDRHSCVAYAVQHVLFWMGISGELSLESEVVVRLPTQCCG